MKKIKNIVLLVIVVTFFSCSSNDTVAEVETPSVLKLYINGEEQYTDYGEIYKIEDKMVIKLGQIHKCEFDVSGRFAFFRIKVPAMGSTPEKTYSSFKYNSSQNFTLNIESIDEVNKRIKGSFAGYVYFNPTNLNSEKKFINGEFDFKYKDLVPTVFGLKNRAKINGNEWVKLVGEPSHIQYSTYYQVTHRDYSDDEYIITLNYQLMNGISNAPNAIGVYNFTSTGITNNMRIAKYDTVTGTLINYNTTGSFEITNYADRIITGNYSFSGVNPNNPSDVLQVTDGEFKLPNIFFN